MSDTCRELTISRSLHHRLLQFLLKGNSDPGTKIISNGCCERIKYTHGHIGFKENAMS
jgi:hypothetical protein